MEAALSEGETALFMASGDGHAKVVKTLLSTGAAVNAARTDGVTSLTMAALTGHSDIVELLLAHGAEVNQIWRNEKVGHAYTAATTALGQGHLACLRLLFKAGADLTIGSPGTFELATSPEASTFSPACVTFVKQAQQATTPVPSSPSPPM
jgi:ankyrin repeat protein